MRALRLSCPVLGLLVFCSQLQAIYPGAVQVTTFPQISDAQFVNISPVGIGPQIPAPITIGSLTISSGTIDAGAQFGDFISFSVATTNDPGSPTASSG